MVKRILALEPYYAGSHRAFLDGWSDHSCHEFTIIGLQASKWKWRMRHSAVTMADDVHARLQSGERWDVVFCSDMLNLAEFRGLVGADVATLPTIAYFHENQLTYPVRQEKERDIHFGLTNFTSGLAANQIWFNSAYHRDIFLDALPPMLKKMPDYRMLEKIGELREKSLVMPPGIPPIAPGDDRAGNIPHLLWAARWEHDKNPELFFDAMYALQTNGIKFRLSVVGEQFSRVPEIFDRAHEQLSSQIDSWGYQPTREKYEDILRRADIFVSSADHEFFGITAIEAMAAGAFPLLPHRLAYPEILSPLSNNSLVEHFYDGSLTSLVESLHQLCDQISQSALWGNDPTRCVRLAEKFSWSIRAGEMDQAIQAL